MAKQGLRKSGFLKDQIGLIWGEEQTVKAKKRRGRRRREEEEEGIKPKRYGNYFEYGCLPLVWNLTLGMETTLSMDFLWIT